MFRAVYSKLSSDVSQRSKEDAYRTDKWTISNFMKLLVCMNNAVWIVACHSSYGSL